MNQHQLLCRLQCLNAQIADSVEGLSAVAHMVDICDDDNAPMGLQLSALLKVCAGYAANASNQIEETLQALKGTE